MDKLISWFIFDSVMDMFDVIKSEAKNLTNFEKGCHDWDHTERVLRLCMHIGDKENADMEILKYAAILHDIGRKYESDSKGKICHAEKGAEMAKEILEKHGFDEEKIKKIIHCIETHRFRGNKIPVSKEAKVLFDADKLDSIGAIGIGRTFLFAGQHGGRLYNNKNEMEKAEEYSEEDTALREFSVKLRMVKDKMQTEEGKRLAKERHDFMVDFFERLDKEVNGLN